MAQGDTDLGPHQTTPLLGALLRKPYQILGGDGIEPAMAEAGYAEIRSAHLPVLQALTANPQGLRLTELAGYARNTTQSMGSLVDFLVGRGYVERTQDEMDGRAKDVRPTERGWDVSRVIRDAVRQTEAGWSERIGRDRIERLRQILRELTFSFEREHGRRGAVGSWRDLRRFPWARNSAITSV